MPRDTWDMRQIIEDAISIMRILAEELFLYVQRKAKAIARSYGDR